MLKIVSRTRKPPRRNAQPEYEMQKAVFAWAGMLQNQYPALRLLEGSMNGVKLSVTQASKAKAAGMLKGSHDIKLPVARGGYVGLSIELKVGKNKPTDEQIEYGDRLCCEGWQVVYVWDDWEKVTFVILAYLSGCPKFIETGSIHAFGGSIPTPSYRIEL